MVDYRAGEMASEWAEFRSSHSCLAELEPLDLAPTDVFLDLGCGMGAHVLAAAGQVKESWGVDLSAAMLDVAATCAREKKLSNAHWIRRDLRQPTSWDLPPVTKIFSWGALHYLTAEQQISLFRSLRSATAREVVLCVSLPLFSVPATQRKDAIAGHVDETSRQSHRWAQELRKVLESSLTRSALSFERAVHCGGFAAQRVSSNRWGTWSEYILRGVT